VVEIKLTLIDLVSALIGRACFLYLVEYPIKRTSYGSNTYMLGMPFDRKIDHISAQEAFTEHRKEGCNPI
jgi:hypothetical protein